MIGKCVFIFLILLGIKKTNSEDVLIVKMPPPTPAGYKIFHSAFTQKADKLILTISSLE